MRNLVLNLKNPILHRPIWIPLSINSIPSRRPPSILSFCQRDTHTHTHPEIMGVSKDELVSSLTSKLSPSHLEVIDTSGGCGASFMVEVVSEQFEGKRLLERHRMVNAALENEMKEIHALSITKALTPEQWKKQLEAAQSESPAS
ncbi:hypothetical protein V2J09_016671 [Rumex salicifolius]